MKKRPAKTVTAKVQTQPMAAANTAKAAETKVTEKAPEVKAEVKTEVKAEAETKIAEKVNEVAEKAAEIAVEKAAETKTAVKAAAKKTAEKKTAEKVGTAKKTAAAKKAEKAPLIPEIKIQFAGNEADEDEIVNAIKNKYVSEGHRASAIKSLQIYLKPEENAAYYVINQKSMGMVPLF